MTYLPQNRYILFLERMLKRITEGLKLKYFDDDTIGNKSTHCSWGLCSEDREAWPDAQDHLWPDQFPRRIAPLYPRDKQKCPFDYREKHDGQGCFYTCRFFNPKGRKKPGKAEAMELYQVTIRKAKHDKN